ncbi:hypothetical protein CLCR_08969 [Cladophialophora carrionii]|uniref:RWD domain-containing protein n=1 Tax=Cladophialophora carrionii TaxID=86049 RepID=A0A1C1CRE7_9EURO|nr:hypothetical protein CLCR_08969 [Cladophialophora carrionii]
MAYIDASENSTRFENELALLEAMYPDLISFDSKSRELKYTSPNSSSAVLVLRLQDQYPAGPDKPQIISASDGSRNDIRDKVQQAFETVAFDEQGSEILDILLNRFEEVMAETTQVPVAETSDGQHNAIKDNRVDADTGFTPPSKTVIIWLHHLLATSKRKLAVNPSLNARVLSPKGYSSPDISGITKPGYPGIMIFSGRSDLVNAHVGELKALNWQAFQIRYDSAEESKQHDHAPDEWQFSCGKGKIVEVGTMAELVQSIVKEHHKSTFLQAVGLK